MQVKKKFMDLFIFEKIEDYWKITQKHEEDLRLHLTIMPVEVKSIFNCITNNSRKRFNYAIEIIKKLEKKVLNLQKTPRRARESNLLFNNEMKLETSQHEKRNFNNLLGDGKTTLRRLSLDAERRKGKYGGTKNGNLCNDVEKNSGNKSSVFINSMNSIQSESSFSCLFPKNIDCNLRSCTEASFHRPNIEKANISQEELTSEKISKALNEGLSNKISFQARKIKSKPKSELIKIDLTPSVSPSNLPSINKNLKKSLQSRKNKQTVNEDKELTQKEDAPSYIYVDLMKPDFLKNYEILKIEANPYNFIPKKADSKKNAFGKIYSELMNMNQNIKRVITAYYLEHQKFSMEKNLCHPLRKTIFLEKPLMKAKPFASSLPSVEFSKSPVVFPVRNPRQGDLLIKHKIESESREEKQNTIHHVPQKNQKLMKSQHSTALLEGLAQENTRVSRVLQTFSKFDASFFRQESPLKTIESEDKNKTIQERNRKSTSLKELSPKDKHRQRKSFEPHFNEKIFMIEPLHQNRQTLTHMSLQKKHQETKSILISNGSQLNDAKVKIGNNSQSTNSILAKINQEQYLNQQIFNKHFY